MASFIPPYSNRFAERLERVKELRTQKEKENRGVEERHRGRPLVFSRDDRNSRDTDISRYEQLLPGAQPTQDKSALSRATTNFLLATLAARLSGDSRNEPIWRRLSTPKAAPRSQNALKLRTGSERFWLPSGLAGTQTQRHEEIGAISDRSSHRRNNPTGRKKLAVERRFKRLERRASSGLNSTSTSTPLPSTPKCSPRRMDSPVHTLIKSPIQSEGENSSVSFGACRKHLLLPVTLVCARPFSEIHAILACRPSCSRAELLDSLKAQLHVSPSDDVNGDSAAPQGILSNSVSKLLIAEDIILFADRGYQGEKSCSLRKSSIPDYPFTSRGGFEHCGRIEVRLRPQVATSPSPRKKSPARPSTSNN